MKPIVFIIGVAASAVAVDAEAEPIKPPPPVEETLPVVRPQVRSLLEDSPSFRSLPQDDKRALPQSERLERRCQPDVDAVPVVSQKPGTKLPPTTIEKDVGNNRILLVDLGERELTKREKLKKRNSRGSTGTRMPACGERIEVNP